MARRKSNNQWSGGIAAHPAKKFRVQNPLENMTSSSLIIFQKAKLSTRLLISAGAIEGHFEGKTPL